MLLHSLIKNGTTARVQPASQSAGYEEQQSNPPTLGLDVSVTVIAAPLGVAFLRQSRLRSSGRGGREGARAEEEGSRGRRVAEVGVWGKGCCVPLET